MSSGPSLSYADLRTSENSLTRPCRILHKIGPLATGIHPPESPDLAGELVEDLRDDPLVHQAYEEV